MRTTLSTTLLFFLLLFFQFPVLSQNGNWNPPGADFSFPRVLLKEGQKEAVHSSLTDPVIHSLYNGVYGSAMAAPPADNELSNDRRLRATIAKNAAFVLYLQRRPQAGTTLAALTATEHTQLTNKVRQLLENLNPAVEGPEKYTEWQWRSKELIDYLIAYDLLRGAGVSVTELEREREKLQTFAGNLYTRSTAPVFGLVFFNLVKNNHALMTASALGVAAVVLNDVQSSTATHQPANWLNAGLFHLDNVLWRDAQRQSEPGAVAGYYEGPYYFKYAFLNCLPFLRALGHFLPDQTLTCSWGSTSRQIRNPASDPNYDLLYEWITAITLPDGRLPALEDSFIDMAMPELALTGKQQYVPRLHLQNLLPAQLNTLSKQLDGTVDMRAAYIAANVPPAPPAAAVLTALPNSGNLVFRSGEGFESNYLHLYGKHGLALANTGGHNQGDASSFSLYAQGQMLALDPGYIRSTRRQELGNATNHNLILVDGAGPLIGDAGNPRDAEAYVENAFSTPSLTYGQVRTAYQGATVVRKAVQVRGEYFLLADFVTSGQPHQYTWQLHGYGLEGGTAAEGTFTPDFANHRGRWSKNGVSLLAHVTATDGASGYNQTISPHELTYDQTQNHSTMLVRKEGQANTQFLSVLYPYTSTPPAVTTVQTPQVAGVLTSTGNFQDLAFTQTGTELKTMAVPGQENVSSDASFTFVSFSKEKEIRQLLLQNGTRLRYGALSLLETSQRVDLVFQKTSPDRYEGRISRAGVLTVALQGAPREVQGPGISGWQYLAAEKQLQITFSGPSSFSYQEVQSVLRAPKADQKKTSLEVWPVPAQEVLTVKAGQLHQPVSLRLFSAEGRQVLEQSFAGQTQLSVKGLVPGVYFLHLHPAGGTPEVRKVVVVR
jgi:hypothetical protein